MLQNCAIESIQTIWYKKKIKLFCTTVRRRDILKHLRKMYVRIFLRYYTSIAEKEYTIYLTSYISCHFLQFFSRIDVNFYLKLFYL